MEAKVQLGQFLPENTPASAITILVPRGAISFLLWEKGNGRRGLDDIRSRNVG